MSMMVGCVNFCIDELLWMLSWGWYQLALGICFMWFLYIFIGRMKIIPALILTLGAYAFAIVVYFSFVAGLFVNYLQWRFVAGGVPHVFGPLYASLFLGLIYSVLQLLFYCIISYWRNVFVARLFVFSLLSNIAAALVASCFIKVIF
jgi:hypothetical protein